jgi:hypothetical protein
MPGGTTLSAIAPAVIYLSISAVGSWLTYVTYGRKFWGPDSYDAYQRRWAYVQHVLRAVIGTDLFCDACGTAVHEANCTGWDEDGHVYCDCNASTPLVHDHNWKPPIGFKPEAS